MKKKPKRAVAKIAKPKARKSATKLQLVVPAPIAEQGGKPAAKEKRIRGSFSMPMSDYALIAELKEVSKKAGRPVKKNELLRAGLRALKAMNHDALNVAIAALTPVKSVHRKPAT
jgi:hypothetical protein